MGAWGTSAPVSAGVAATQVGAGALQALLLVGRIPQLRLVSDIREDLYGPPDLASPEEGGKGPLTAAAL